MSVRGKASGQAAGAASAGAVAADPRPGDEPGPRRDPAMRLLTAGVALVVAGTAATLAGLILPSLFRIGTTIILIGLIVAVAAGLWSSVRHEPEPHG